MGGVMADFEHLTQKIRYPLTPPGGHLQPPLAVLMQPALVGQSAATLDWASTNIIANKVLISLNLGPNFMSISIF